MRAGCGYAAVRSLACRSNRGTLTRPLERDGRNGGLDAGSVYPGEKNATLQGPPSQSAGWPSGPGLRGGRFAVCEGRASRRTTGVFSRIAGRLTVLIYDSSCTRSAPATSRRLKGQSASWARACACACRRSCVGAAGKRPWSVLRSWSCSCWVDEAHCLIANIRNRTSA